MQKNQIIRKIIDSSKIDKIDTEGILITKNTKLKKDQSTKSSWDLLYQQSLSTRSYKKDFENYKKNYFKSVYRQLTEAGKLTENSIYLEIGCGEFFMGALIAKKVRLVIGVDYSRDALLIAREVLRESGVANYILIQGDIRKMPIKDSVIDLSYGGGVIEHFRDTENCVKELYRVTKEGGVAFNSVPCLNIGSLTYRQLWGNIPYLPIISDLFEFIHIKLLGGKHMKFGYERSFLPTTLRRMHKIIGFKSVFVDRFDISLSFEFIPTFLRKYFIRLATINPLFWPMIKVVAIK